MRYSTQIGVFTGTRAAQTVIRESGHEDRIARGLKQAMERALTEIKEKTTGVEFKHKLLNKTSPYGDLGPTEDFHSEPSAAESLRDDEHVPSELSFLFCL
jgi:hypothetical protein